ncbi:Nif3-like dinuclear metal center hexameric protein [Terrimonas pollutisoli]|uniref:Nif3-like dinuclear metal center hexameric protein n=1 Tax=Terrimonas pollutisoli TaxID=3034147 RepID=UPI0023EC327D|nr:Nif3-like dinuclear metal center hexameric protein [Terrimonas sp. H1YJ31]
MLIAELISFLESIANRSLQESYDNAGLITGDPGWECSGVICCLDSTEEVIDEAIKKKCNLVIAHHPIIFKGLKKINGRSYVERTVIKAIKNDIAIYAIHTNLDNILGGVSGEMAKMLGLQNVSILAPKESSLKKLFVFVPVEKAEQVRNAIFDAGGGQIGNYSECSFNAEGWGTFKAGPGTNPFVGKISEQHQEKELKIEVIFPTYLEAKIVGAMKSAHPYEEVAYDIVELVNVHPKTGSGVIGELQSPMDEINFLKHLKSVFKLPLIRHTNLRGKPISKVAVCGGAGSFLIFNALSLKADIYITGDIKYHEFFDANGQMIIADIGHYESEQFTINLLQEILVEKFPTFAVLKTEVITNPVYYF